MQRSIALRWSRRTFGCRDGRPGSYGPHPRAVPRSTGRCILTAYPDEAFRREARGSARQPASSRATLSRREPEVLIRLLRIAVAIARGDTARG